MANEYYIRIRGVVKGPLTHDQILTQIRRKRLGRHHEMSVDAITWQKAGDMPELFAPIVPPRSDAVSESQSVDIEPEAVPAEETEVVEALESEWFYAKNGNQLGPVAEAELSAMFAQGNLNSATLIWKEGFEKWILASEVSEFASAFVDLRPAPTAIAESHSHSEAGFWEVLMGTSQAAVLPANAIYKYPNLSRYLKIAEISARVIFVLKLTLLLIACCVGVGMGLSLDEWRWVAGSCVAIPAGGLLLWLMFITWLAFLELIRVWIKIEDNTSN